MRAYSQDIRDRVIAAYKENIDINIIIKMFKICKKTYNNWVCRYNETGSYSSRQNLILGRKPRYDDKAAILKHIEANPDDDGIAIRDATCPELPMSTFYDTMKRMEITCKKKSQNIRNVKKKNAQHI